MPIVFVHGNSDIAVGLKPGQTGYTQTISYLLTQNYSKAEMYATTWGTGDYSKHDDESHDKKRIMYIRAFVEAVLRYTQAS